MENGVWSVQISLSTLRKQSRVNFTQAYWHMSVGQYVVTCLTCLYGPSELKYCDMDPTEC